MGYTLKNKKRMLADIEIGRTKIAECLKSGIITEDDIFSLKDKISSFGLTQTDNPKQRVLRTIFNYPYLLCDQENLGLLGKQMLPILLEYRYEIELSEIKYRYEEGYYSKKEYEEYIDKLNFIYYKSSIEGKEIFKNSTKKSIKTKILKISK